MTPEDRILEAAPTMLAALKKWKSHSVGCAAVEDSRIVPQHCDCGHREALAAIAQAEGRGWTGGPRKARER